MKQTLRNTCVLATIGLVCLGASGGCAGADAGGKDSNTAGTFGTGGSSAGMTAQPMAGTAPFASAGTFGTPITGGTFSMPTAGSSAAGGDAAGGLGGASGGTGGVPGAGGTPAGSDFPANCPAPAASHSQMAATRTCWTAIASECAMITGNDGLQNPAVNAIDAAGITTRFSTGAKMLVSKTFTFDIDLGSAIMIDGVNVTSAMIDYPPQLEVQVSTDNVAFTSVVCGAGGLTTDLAFAPSNARYVRLIQHGTADSWWSIHDLNIYRSAADSCTGGGTQTNMCTITHMML